MPVLVNVQMLSLEARKDLSPLLFDLVDPQNGDRSGIAVSFRFDAFLCQGKLTLLFSARSRL